MEYRSLEELSKSDSEFRKMAYKICKCHFISDELVNAFYIKYYNSMPELISDGYVYRSLQNLYKNYKRDRRFFTSIGTDIEQVYEQYDFDIESELEHQRHLKVIKEETEINGSTSIEDWYDRTIFKYIVIDKISIRKLSKGSFIDRSNITDSYKRELERIKNKLNENG